MPAGCPSSAAVVSRASPSFAPSATIEQPHITFERPVRAAQAIRGRVARHAGVDRLRARGPRPSASAAASRDTPLRAECPRPAVRLSPSTTTRGTAGCDGCDGRGRVGCEAARDSSGCGGADRRARDRRKHRRGKRRTRATQSIYLSTTPRSAVVYSRPWSPSPFSRRWRAHGRHSSAAVTPTRSRAHPGSESHRASSTKISSVSVHARRSLAHGRRRRAGRVARSDDRRTLHATIFRRRSFRRCGGCTAESRSPKAISRAPSPCSAARCGTREQAHDSEAIGLAHYELGLCYKQVGDTAIVREHIAKAAPALHAAGNRRYLALLHSLSGVVLAQGGRIEEAIAAFRQAERLAAAVQAHDVLGIVCNNQANVALFSTVTSRRWRWPSAARPFRSRSGPGAASPFRWPHWARFSSGSDSSNAPRQCCIARSRSRSPTQFHEITGAVYDTLAQIALMRGDVRVRGRLPASGGRSVRRLRRDRPASGTSGRFASSKPSSRARRGLTEDALRLANEIATPRAPPAEAIQADLIACEALLAAGRAGDAEARLARSRAASMRARCPARGESFFGCAARCTARRAGCRRRTTTSPRVRASSSSSAKDIKVR